MGAGLGFAEQSFDLAPHHFDGVEVGRIGRQEPDLRAHLPNEFEGLFVLVCAQVVEDDDVAGPQGRPQDFADVGLEDLRVGRPLDRHAGTGPIQPNRGDHRGRAPMPVRSVADQPFALGRAAAQSGQISFGGRLVDEDEPGGIESSLGPPPLAARLDDIGPVLFGGMERLFLYVRPSFTNT